MKYNLLQRGNSTAISSTQRTQKLCMDHLIKNQTLAKTRQLRRPKQLTSLRRLKLPSDHLMILLMMTMTSSQKSVSQKPQTDLLFTTCKVLYDDGVWYDGTVCGFEYCETESIWKYKISFPDGETTLITLNDPEVKLSVLMIKVSLFFLYCVFHYI